MRRPTTRNKRYNKKMFLQQVENDRILVRIRNKILKLNKIQSIEESFTNLLSQLIINQFRLTDYYKGVYFAEKGSWSKVEIIKICTELPGISKAAFNICKEHYPDAFKESINADQKDFVQRNFLWWFAGCPEFWSEVFRLLKINIQKRLQEDHKRPFDIVDGKMIFLGVS
ncbi:hypothetical protein ACFL35_17340 [Candidatus Riflebacteria bacterium]